MPNLLPFEAFGNSPRRRAGGASHQRGSCFSDKPTCLSAVPQRSDSRGSTHVRRRHHPLRARRHWAAQAWHRITSREPKLYDQRPARTIPHETVSAPRSYTYSWLLVYVPRVTAKSLDMPACLVDSCRPLPEWAPCLGDRLLGGHGMARLFGRRLTANLL